MHSSKKALQNLQDSLFILLICSSVLTCDTSEYCDIGDSACSYTVVSVHYTMGGVEINEKAQVLNMAGNHIENLYAAGEVTGGVHGNNRLGTLSIPDTVTFGRIAAQTCWKENH